jgi:hypothetical protein
MVRSPARTATLVAVPIALLAGALVFWSLGGLENAPEASSSGNPQATTPVSVPAPSLDATTAEACRALLAKLPESVRDRAERPVSGGAEQNAAYGDPPIVLSCGVTRPSVPQVADLIGISGVCWWPEEQSDRDVYTTVDREVPVRVTVPKAYSPSAQWVANFSSAITGSLATVPARPGTTCSDTVPSPR